MTAAPSPEKKDPGGSWALWETLAKTHPDFGRPPVFNRNIDESKWLSFTVTLRDPAFFNLMEAFTGNKAGTGGLVTVTFVDSRWLMSIVLPRQPHFINQPETINVFWGYGLFPEEDGDYVKKKMSECTGEELMIELLGHLRFDERKDLILKTSNCIPCMMPFITSQFMPRVMGDRPLVRRAETPEAEPNSILRCSSSAFNSSRKSAIFVLIVSEYVSINFLIGILAPVYPMPNGFVSYTAPDA